MKRALILIAILGGLTGLAFLVARPHVPDPATEPYFGVRGASRAKAAGLGVHFKRGGDAEHAVDPRTVLRAGDTLRFVVRGERPRQLEVRVRDGDAAPATIFPGDGAPLTIEVRPGETLPVRPTLAAGGAKLIVTALFSDRPRAVGTPPDNDTEVVTLAIPKE
ncbi:MAG TPA: hypothetical protein VKQ32_02195 [Polyangia bacterium]|nr:hypothetical protein [Polyangia bacterium]